MKLGKQLQGEIRTFIADLWKIGHPLHDSTMKAIDNVKWDVVERFLEEIATNGDGALGLDETTVSRARELQKRLLAS